MMRKGLVGILMVVMTAGMALAGSQGLWLHVKVEEDGRDGESVRINIPLSLVEELLPLIQIDEFDRGKIRIDALGMDDELEGIDFLKMWEAIQNAGDAEFVRIQADDADVRVVKEGDWILIETSEDSREQVNIRFPLAVVDAMFSGEPGELDLLAAVEALGRYGRGGDLVRVQDGRDLVRVWIDERDSD
jgi:hypothetical protein